MSTEDYLNDIPINLDPFPASKMSDTKMPDDLKYPDNWTMLLTPNDFGDYVLSYKQIKELLGAWQLREERIAADEVTVRELREEIAALNLLAERPEDGECFTCKQRTNSLAADPSQWAMHLPFKGGNGRTRTYHWGCVTESIAENTSLRAEVERLKNTTLGLQMLKQVTDERDSLRAQLAEATKPVSEAARFLSRANRTTQSNASGI